jgi:hypothetical protein
MDGHYVLSHQITASNVENLIVLAYHLKLQIVYDQCILWIVQEMRFNNFKLSQQWILDHSEHNAEIKAIIDLIADNDPVFKEDGRLVMELSGQLFFEKLKNIKKFSGLSIKVKGTVPLAKDELKELRVASLDFSSVDQSELFFLDKNVSYPILKSLSLYNANLSDVKKLSDAFNNDKLPVLQKLDLSSNPKIQWATFELKKKINLKSLVLSYCDLTDISFLANLLNEKRMPYLEELDLSSNRYIIMNTLKLTENISLKSLNLARCNLKNMNVWATVVKERMPNLKKLDLRMNSELMKPTDKTEKEIDSLRERNIKVMVRSKIPRKRGRLSAQFELSQTKAVLDSEIQ